MSFMALKYDIITFFNELDLLEIRLEVLNDHVDYFVLVEAAQTFSGHDKPLYYAENKERFAKWNHKIIHYVVEEGNEEVMEMAKRSPNVGQGEHYWVREFYQKEMIKKALMNLNDEDICYVSDVDEIWNPKMKLEVGDLIYKPRQLPYMYYLNFRTDEDWREWTGTIVTKYKNIKDACLNHLRTDEMTPCVEVPNGGWHFSFLGGAEKKIEAFKHPVYTPAHALRKEVNTRFDEKDLPEYILNNKTKWARYLL